MSPPTSLDLIAENVKTLVDKNRCSVCDILGGSRWRYWCGHTACEDCVISTRSCLLCLTPPGRGEFEPVQDLLFTQRVKNVQCLLNECQSVFNIDVNRRHRLSEQNRIEKQLFPESIHASTKYFNKKRNAVIPNQKENCQILYFPGEEVSIIGTKMEKTDYIENWLNKNEKILSTAHTRKPFRDLNVNKQDSKILSNVKIKHRADIILDKVKENNINTASLKKMTHKRKVMQENVYPEIKQRKRDVTDIPHVKCDKNESGIEIDEEVILIEDSQVVDKDQQALLAVLEAERKRTNKNAITNHTKAKENKDTNNKPLFNSKRVPFIKKADLFQSCSNCMNKSTKIEPTKDLSITIENDSFVTTIKMTNIKQNLSPVTNKTISIQTDISNVSEANIKGQRTTVLVSPSQDVFMDDLVTADDEKQQIKDHIMKTINDQNADEKKLDHDFDGLGTSKGMIVAESDSDADINDSFTIECRAEVHRSGDQVDHEVLNELESEDVAERNNRVARGITPTSSNSSEKENFNPNKAKRLAKKKKKKHY